MNQELVMMLNGVEGARLSSDTVQVSTDGMISSLYDELQQNIADVSQPMEVVPGDISYKAIDCAVLSGDIPVTIDTTASSISDEGTLKFINEGNICSTSIEDQDTLKDKTIDIPDAWNIALLESNDMNPPSTIELSAESEKLGYQLYECPNCGALFRDKDVCEQHVHKSHNFTCGLCNEPFQEKEALEIHIINHIQQVPGSILQRISLDKEYLDTSDPKDAKPQDARSTDIPPASDNVFSCMECNLTFSSVDDLAKHKECHYNDEEENPPSSLPKTLEESFVTSKPTISLESVSKSPGSKFACEVCHQMFFTRNSLLLHMTKKHPNSNSHPKNYACGECGTSFKWKVSLQKHQIAEHGKRKN